MSQPTTKQYRVWFDQVNQTVYEVQAKDELSAIAKAQRQWKREHGTPEVAEWLEKK